MVEICQASDADVDTILEFIEPFVQKELLLPRDADEIRRLAKTGFVAREEDQVIGFSSLDIYSKKMAEIQCLAVHSNHQNRGIGRMLVVACIKLAKREGILELMAISSSDEFLKQCGFDYSLPNQKRALFYRFDQNTTD